jgi:hypothetical protein
MFQPGPEVLGVYFSALDALNGRCHDRITGFLAITEPVLAVHQ